MAFFSLIGLLPEFSPEINVGGWAGAVAFFLIVVVVLILFIIPFMIVAFFMRLLLERFTDYRGLTLIELAVDIIWGSFLAGFFILMPIGIILEANELSPPGPVQDAFSVAVISFVIAWQVTRHIPLLDQEQKKPEIKPRQPDSESETPRS